MSSTKPTPDDPTPEPSSAADDEALTWTADTFGGAKTTPEKLTERHMLGATKEMLVATAEVIWPLVKDVVHEDHVILNVLQDKLEDAIKKCESYMGVLDGVGEEYNAVLAEMKAAKAGEVKVTPAMKASWRKRLDDASAKQEKDVTTALTLTSMAFTPDGQIMSIGLARWADNGYPQVTMGHKYAASLLGTAVSEDVLEYVKPPWDGFVIEVPDGLLDLFHNGLQEYRPVRRIVVTQHANRHTGDKKAWCYIALTDTTVSVWRFGVTTAELLPSIMEGDLFRNGKQTLEMTDRDDRTTALIGRLIVNTCLAMSDPTAVKSIGPGHKAYQRGNRRETKEPVLRTFQVGKPVQVDLREQVRAYLTGESKRMLNVQVMVAGHWRNQPYGPKHSLRRMQWISPHWRGPEDAPILVRPHSLEKE